MYSTSLYKNSHIPSHPQIHPNIPPITSNNDPNPPPHLHPQRPLLHNHPPHHPPRIPPHRPSLPPQRRRIHHPLDKIPNSPRPLRHLPHPPPPRPLLLRKPHPSRLPQRQILCCPLRLRPHQRRIRPENQILADGARVGRRSRQAPQAGPVLV